MPVIFTNIIVHILIDIYIQIQFFRWYFYFMTINCLSDVANFLGTCEYKIIIVSIFNIMTQPLTKNYPVKNYSLLCLKSQISNLW
jgi:hypothetical protein